MENFKNNSNAVIREQHSAKLQKKDEHVQRLSQLPDLS